MTSVTIPVDEFARQLSLDELGEATSRAAAAGRVVLCSAGINGLEQIDANLGTARAAAFERELTLFVRKNLRGMDAVAWSAGELLILLDGSAPQDAVIKRVLGAVSRHVFSSLGDTATRATLSIGVASAPEHGTSFQALLLAARDAREAALPDRYVRAFAYDAGTLDFSRFIGRIEQLGLLANLLDDTIRGAGRVVGIIGERGVGTSALIRALTPEVRLRSGSLVVAACREKSYVAPYALWIEVLRGLRRLPIKSTRQWRELPSLDPTLERSSQEGEAGGSKTHLFEELADFLRLAAQQRPLVLVLENLHHADAASWEALEYLVTQIESERILLVLTMEPGGENDATDRWSHLGRSSRHSEIRLSHLTRDDVKRWLEIVMRPTEASRELLSYVYRHSEGNPLVLTHLLRDLLEGGHLASTDGAWHSSPVSELPVTQGLDDLLERRIARLPAAAQEVLLIASLMRREITDAQIIECMNDATGARLGINQLLESGVLCSTYDRGRAAFTLSHDEIARVARGRLSSTGAAAVHRSLARVLSQSQRPYAAEIADHFERAGNQVDAHRYALRAADHALTVYETGAAAELLGAAERNAPTEEAAADVRVHMARLAEEAGRYEDAEALCDAALEWFEQQNDRTNALKLKRMRALVRMKRGQAAQETLEVLLTLEAEAREVGADAERAAVLLLIAQMHWRLGDPASAQRVAEEAVEIARRGDDEILVADACNRLAVTLQLGNVARARALFMNALEIATARGDAFRRVRGLNNLGILEMFSNNTEEAHRVLTVAVDQARTAGLTESWGRAELNLGVLAARIGDYEAAGRAFSEALRLTAMVQNSEEQLYATYNLANLERDNDRPKVAADTYELVVDLAERIGQVPIQAGAYAGLGLCRLVLGEEKLAREALRMADMLSERIESWWEGREYVVALSLHFHLFENDIEGASALFSQSLVLADAGDISGALWLVAQFGSIMLSQAPELVRESYRKYHDHPEVLGNPKLRKQFEKLSREI